MDSNTEETFHSEIKTLVPDTHTYASGSVAKIFAPYNGEGCTAMPLLVKQLVADGKLDLSDKTEVDESSARGTRIHNLGANYLELLKRNRNLPDCSEEESRVAFEYAVDVYEFLNQSETFVIEERGHLLPDVSGTMDVQDYQDTTLIIIDLKTGFIPVYPEFNEQLLFYASTVIADYPDVTKVKLGIYQPKEDDDNLQIWECSPQVVLDYKFKLLEILDKIDQGDVQVKPDSYCKNCKARDYCPQLNQDLVTINEIQKQAGTDLVSTLTEEQRLQAFLVKDRVKEFIKALEEHYYKEATERNNIPPQHKLVAGRSTRRWVEDEKTLVEILSNAGIDPHVSELKTAPAVEKEIGKKAFKEFEYMVTKTPGKPRLVHESERGKPIEIVQAERAIEIFGEDLN